MWSDHSAESFSSRKEQVLFPPLPPKGDGKLPQSGKQGPYSQHFILFATFLTQLSNSYWRVWPWIQSLVGVFIDAEFVHFDCHVRQMVARLCHQLGLLPVLTPNVDPMGMKYQYGWNRICLKTDFSLQLTFRPNKLDCYITLGWKGLSGTNTLAHWGPLIRLPKLKYCEYASRISISELFYAKDESDKQQQVPLENIFEWLLDLNCMQRRLTKLESAH